MKLLNSPQNEAPDDLSALDVACVLDTTGSMGPLLHAAQSHLTALLRDLSAGASHALSLRVGFVEYRDHPPQDTVITRVHAFTADLKRAQKTVEGFRAQGGGDGPEAVFDGIVAAVDELDWRQHAQRVAVLIGDAPPHGMGAPGDGFREGCPCGETPDSVSARAENARITLYAIGLQPNLERYFEPLAASTGGQFWHSPLGHSGGRGRDNDNADPIARLKSLLEAERAHMDFDRRVLEMGAPALALSNDELAQTLETSRSAIAASRARLGRRELI